MPRSIRLTDPLTAPESPKRLNLFPGRAMGEAEFELLQTYVDDRVEPLLQNLPPGILRGLEVAAEVPSGRIRIHPGMAVGAGGALVRLTVPMDLAWEDLRDLALRRDQAANQHRTLADGLHLLTLQVEQEAVDEDLLAAVEARDPDWPDPCTRTEADPLRKSRFHMTTLPGLHFLGADPALMVLDPERTANRVCASFVTQGPPALPPGSVSLALLRAADDQLIWLDPLAGRLMAGPLHPQEGAPLRPATHMLLVHTLEHLERWTRLHPAGPVPGPLRPLQAVLGLDVLPAAGPLPPSLLLDPGGTPTLAFAPQDLQVELVPIPESTAPSVLEAELDRGVVDLAAHRGDRIRLLLAIPDLIYDPNLLDRPQRDPRLEDELFRRGQAAREAWVAWWQAWLGINAQSDVSPDVDLPAIPSHPGRLRTSLVKRRRYQLRVRTKLDLPEPYRSHLLNPRSAPPGFQRIKFPPSQAGNLVANREALQRDLEARDKVLAEGRGLLQELNDHLGLQRNQLDTLAISFSALAGGVPGDGSGAALLRWSPTATLDPNLPTSATP